MNDKGRLWYFTTTYEQRFFEGETLTYQKPSGLPIDSLEVSYIDGIVRRFKAYFQYHVEDSRIHEIIDCIMMIREEVVNKLS